jgi:hypothetical protein
MTFLMRDVVCRSHSKKLPRARNVLENAVQPKHFDMAEQ